MIHSFKAVLFAVGALLAVSPPSHAQVIYGKTDSNLMHAQRAMMAGELETASKFYKRAVKANLGAEHLVMAFNNLCAIEYSLGDMQRAEKTCSHAIGKNRHYWRAYVNRGNVHVALGNIEAAHSDYIKAVKLKPSAKIAANALAHFENNQTPLLAAAQ